MVGESWFLCHPMEGYSMFYPQVMTISLRTGSHGPFMVDDLPKEIHWFQILTLPGIEGCLQVALRVGKPVAAIAQITGSRGCLKHSMEGICTWMVHWLVVWNMNGLFFHILGMSSSQLTHIFQRGWNHQPVQFEAICIYIYILRSCM